MSALGQKATCAPQMVMSALPPKADMCSALADVCFGPKADIGEGDRRMKKAATLAASFRRRRCLSLLVRARPGLHLEPFNRFLSLGYQVVDWWAVAQAADL